MKEKFSSISTVFALWVLTGLLGAQVVLTGSDSEGAMRFYEQASALIARVDAPAWVQAVGSIGAILVAVAIAGWQGHAERRRKANESAEQLAQQRALGIALIEEISFFCENNKTLFLMQEVSKLLVDVY